MRAGDVRENLHRPVTSSSCPPACSPECDMGGLIPVCGLSAPVNRTLGLGRSRAISSARRRITWQNPTGGSWSCYSPSVFNETLGSAPHLVVKGNSSLDLYRHFSSVTFSSKCHDWYLCLGIWQRVIIPFHKVYFFLIQLHHLSPAFLLRASNHRNRRSSGSGRFAPRLRLSSAFPGRSSAAPRRTAAGWPAGATPGTSWCSSSSSACSTYWAASWDQWAP